ncbi:MAG: histone deacetylase family protein, partial [Actinomycetota bacterium]|nr:histone deacetylase family protein [Actinomycetota bacterium]
MLVVRSSLQVEHHPRELHPFGGELLPPREIPRRAEVILAAIEASGASRVVEAGPLDADLLAKVHTAEYLEFLETAHTRWCERTGLADGEATPFVRPYLDQPFAAPDDVLAQLGRFSHDTDPLLAGTWRAATGSAAAAADAASAVLAGERSA